MFRLIGIPALAFAGVLIYRGVQERFTLPDCDSSRAKQTLSDVLSQLKVEPLRDEPIKTISSSKQQVACNVVLPLSDGGSLNIDYNFFWQGNTADMRYSISRKPAQKSGTQPPQAPMRPDWVWRAVGVIASGAKQSSLCRTGTRTASSRCSSQ